MWNMDADAKIT